MPTVRFPISVAPVPSDCPVSLDNRWLLSRPSARRRRGRSGSKKYVNPAPRLAPLTNDTVLCICMLFLPTNDFSKLACSSSTFKRVALMNRSPAAGSLHRAGCEDERSSRTGPATLLPSSLIVPPDEAYGRTRCDLRWVAWRLLRSLQRWRDAVFEGPFRQRLERTKFAEPSSDWPCGLRIAGARVCHTPAP